MQFHYLAKLINLRLNNKINKKFNLQFVLSKVIPNFCPKFITFLLNRPSLNSQFNTWIPWMTSADHLDRVKDLRPTDDWSSETIFTLLRRIYLRVSLVSRERKHEKKLFHASFHNDYLSRSSESSRCLFSVPVLGRGRRTRSPLAGSMASIIRL